MKSPEDAVRFVERDMQDIEEFPIGAGLAVVYTHSSPTKDTPNEDAAALIPLSADRAVLVIADGAGGARGGAQASSTTIYELTAALEHAAREGRDLREAILDGIENANREVTTLGIGAASTVAAVELNGNRMRPYHVGDSEILVVGQKGKFKLQTVAHSPMGYAVESGFLSEDQAMVHEDRHFVYNMIGTSEMRIELGPMIELSARDTIVVACDGLFDNLTSHEIGEMMRSGDLATATRNMVDECSRRMTTLSADLPSKPDDLTIITFRLESPAAVRGTDSPDRERP